MEVSSSRNERESDRAAASQRSWLHWAARAGYAACGIVYVAIGAIALAVATGLAERPGDAQRVMRLIERLPLGKVLVITLGVGLLGYAALNLVGAVRDHEERGRTLSGMFERAADALTGAVYIALAGAAVRIVAAPSREGGRVIEAWASGLLILPGGIAMMWCVGLALIGAGAVLVRRGLVEPFEEVLDRRELSSVAWRALAGAARFGTLARGTVLGVCGLLVIEAGATRRPEHVGDVGDALSAIETTPAGTVLLAIVGLGFIAYGAYQLAKVRYRRVQIG